MLVQRGRDSRAAGRLEISAIGSATRDVPQPSGYSDKAHGSICVTQHADQMGENGLRNEALLLRVESVCLAKSGSWLAMPRFQAEAEFINSFESEARNRPLYKTVNFAVFTY